MAVKVLIKRKIKDGKLIEVSRLLNKARYNAMGQQGYISSETLSGCDDPRNVIVISMWQKIENWNQWKDSDLRAENEAAFEALLDEPTEYETYNLGLNL
ncbi:MAG: antibiotic biosynthesis monooxygenase [Pseudomonadota bacterium]|uniref:Antibiotic biosynthesis monooxygenase n=1 Tax=Candidatus Desulfatibia profunda TaxID=2841695 RepID=A0A8J6TG21_9BACT|nr:antibiotic biosynthesis monooxygenase [Candidatus Desulfatibia profunda]MBL7180510.1 antibiotic biosynthesis monooxygenase [Desulfobacterales bacterium]